MIDGGRCVVLIGSALYPGTPISIGAPFADGSLLCIGAPVEAAAPIYARTPPIGDRLSTSVIAASPGMLP